jgi:hypothetical protein
MSFTVISCKVAATLAAQRIVAPLTGTAKAVQYPGSAVNFPIGVTIDSVADTTQAIPVQIAGFAYVLFNDTAAAGQLVASDTSGRGILFSHGATSTAISAPSAYVGVLWGVTVDDTAQVAEVFINPGFGRVGA